MTQEQEAGIMQAFDAYCKTVLRNKARNHHKKSTRKNTIETSLDELPPELEESMQYKDSYDFSHAVPAGLTGQEMHIEDSALAAAVFQCQPRFREVLYLAYFMEYSDKEIREQLNIPTSTVISRRNSTLERLRTIMGENHAV